jgi:ribosome-associated toxin RatA of RatAB toxin-antitoxin module
VRDVNEIRRSALVPFPAEGMFDLIEAAEDYPEFLPWCAGATVLERDEGVVAATIAIDYHGVRFRLDTRNPKQRPQFMAVRLLRGPFRNFEGEWHLSQLAADACKIEFHLRYEFESTVMAKLAGPVFGNIANTLVDAFVRRAEQVYGTRMAGTRSTRNH